MHKNKRIDLDSLPHLAEIYEELKSGRHLTAKNSELFYYLDNYEHDYRKLFSGLGYELIRHEKEFFYFQYGDYFSNYGRKFATFVFVTIDYFADKGIRPEELVEYDMIKINDKPFSPPAKKRYSEIFKKIGIDYDESSPYEQLLKELERFRFIRRDGPYHFKFEKPIYRFLDYAQELVETKERMSSEG